MDGLRAYSEYIPPFMSFQDANEPIVQLCKYNEPSLLPKHRPIIRFWCQKIIFQMLTAAY